MNVLNKDVLTKHVLTKHIVDNLKDLDKLSVESLNIIKKTVDRQQNKLLKIKPIIIKNNNIDVTSIKYILLLKLANLILSNLKKPVITDIREFKNIDRIDIINPIHLEGFNKLIKEIIEHFDKKNLKPYLYASCNVVYLYLKHMCKEIGLKIVTKSFNKQIKTVIKTHYIYSII
jgi:hypothetical protein